jgi:alkanesulfonate monooxygenase SsuD/methylene tetrahydromethanopterin reductase-like flavin-dependent oxidoreductase (luciferase family)
MTRLSFGIKTNPVHIGYDELRRVWREADEVPLIEHAWLWDHLLPLFGDPDGPIFEGWTMLAALAAQTERLRLGLMVTSNALRPPALLAKIAATVDVISGGRLVLGLGVGATDHPRPRQELAVREYEAYGFTMPKPDEGIARLAESCELIRRMWTEKGVDFAGEHYTVKGARAEPKPATPPPLLIGGWGARTLRVVAEHADIWNVPGPPHNSVAYVAERSRILDEHCAALGRDPSEITRSVQTHVHYEEPERTQEAVLALAEAGVTHFALNLPAPFPEGVATWVSGEIIEPVLASVG